MTYDDLLKNVHWYSIKPWLYDFYVAGFAGNISIQQFADHAHEKTGGDINGWQMYTSANSAFFAVPKEKNQIIPDDFADSFSKIEGAPTEPPPEDPPAQEDKPQE